MQLARWLKLSHPLLNRRQAPQMECDKLGTMTFVGTPSGESGSCFAFERCLSGWDLRWLVLESLLVSSPNFRFREFVS